MIVKTKRLLGGREFTLKDPDDIFLKSDPKWNESDENYV